MQHETFQLRVDRIQRTARVVSSRVKVWKAFQGRFCSEGSPSAGHWRKWHPMSCGCSRRRKGQPKIAAGMCHIGCHKGLFAFRRKNRDLGLWSGCSLDWDSDEAYLMLDTKSLYRY